MPAQSAASPANAPRSAGPVRKIIVVFKTHVDLGYTDLAAHVVHSYRTRMMDLALGVVESTRDLPPEHRFVWTLPGWLMPQILGPDQEPGRRRRIVEMIEQGRLVWHALPFTTHTESLELEDLVRGLGFASRTSRQFGLPLPRDAKMTDVPSHVWILPTVLAHAGVTFLHLGCNRGCRSPEVPPLFWWEGPDGSRVLVMQTPRYGSDLLPPADWPHPAWLALMHTNDNIGPPRAEEVRQLLAEVAAHTPGVEVRMGRLSDFADEILAADPQLPVVRADMPDSWIHGLMSMPREMALARRIRPRIAAAEALNTLLRCWGRAVPPLTACVAEAWEHSLLFGEHTWGMDVKLFGPRCYDGQWLENLKEGKYVKLAASWEEHRDYIRRVAGRIEPAAAEQARRLAAAVAVEGPRLAVFNPLPWERDELVALPAEAAAHPAWRDVVTGEVVPTDTSTETARIPARRLPPLGYRTFVPAEPPAGDGEPLVADPARGLLENRWYRLAIDTRRGGISSWVDKAGGRELAGEIDGLCLGQFMLSRYDADNVRQFLNEYTILDEAWVPIDFGKADLPPVSQYRRSNVFPTKFRVKARSGPAQAGLCLHAPADNPLGYEVGLTITIYRDLPHVDLCWHVADKVPTPLPEAGWLCLPLRLERPRFLLGRLGCLTDPLCDIQPGTNHRVHCVNTGLLVLGGDGAGVGICPIDAPLICLDEPGLWRFQRRYEPRRPLVHVNLFNNQWSTNFPQWIEGTWTSRVRLWAVRDDSPAESLLRPAWEARTESLTGLGQGPAGPLPPTAAGLHLSRPGVLVTCLGANPDGEGQILRLWEQAGRAEPCEVRLPAGLRPSQVQPVDLRGRPAGPPIPVDNDGRLTVSLRPFAPVTLQWT